MQSKKIKVSSWLKGNCIYKGCLHNDGFGSCLLEDSDFVDEMLDIVHKSYKDGKNIPDDETFICTYADFNITDCEYCGNELEEYKDNVTGEREFLPIVYYRCSNRDCEGNQI